MKKLLLFIAGLFMVSGLLQAANGDSTVVRVWDKLSMTRYGAFDQKVAMPSSSKKQQRIAAKFTLGCTSNGQCEWDYTITLSYRQHTGKNDSTLQSAPYFKVSNKAPDSIGYSTDTTWVNVYNSTTKKTDSVASTKITIMLYKDSIHPTVLTDSIVAFPANYYRVNFDSTGKRVDSVLVKPQYTIYQKMTPYYKVFEVVNSIELGRFISPYAKAFPKTFQYDYIYDVTDYAKFLADSGELRIDYSGYSFGFTATVDLIYIEGTPPRDVIDVVNVYNGYYNYGQTQSIETKLVPTKFKAPAGTVATKAKITISGHGGESNENCSEFCPKKMYVKLNNTQIAEQLVWKDDCGSNPITAQGGTWIYNRANWCPGERINPYEYALNTIADSNTIDIDMEAFNANGAAGYAVALQLIYYKAYNNDIDLSIEDILAPSKVNWNSKTNPICDNAKIVIKNKGATTITDAWILSQLGNGAPASMHWTGSLKSEETTTVTLPDLLWPTDLSNTTFKTWIGTVNGQPISADQNATNNIQTSQFDLPVTYPTTFIIQTKTNAMPSQNSYTITDSKGTVYKSKTFSAASTMHNDTITLGFGCYTFKFNDNGDNGLGWWAAPSEGTGSLRFITPAPIKVLQTFNVDFGSFTQVNFRVEHAVGLNEQLINQENIKVFPSPASDMLFVEGASFRSAVMLDLSGKEVAHFTEIMNGLDVKNIPTGLYLLKLTTDNKQVVTQKISIAH